jgi:Fe-S-cluster containining protein
VTPSEELDCRLCGACCFGDEGWVHVDGGDDALVDGSSELAALVVLTRHGGFVKRSLRMVDGACAGLDRGADRFTCSVYDSRPTVCRAVQTGSDACRRARRERGLE